MNNAMLRFTNESSLDSKSESQALDGECTLQVQARTWLAGGRAGGQSRIQSGVASHDYVIVLIARAPGPCAARLSGWDRA